MRSVENLLYMRRDQNKTNHNSQLRTLNPQPSTLNSQPSTLNSQPSTLNSQPSTLNPQLSINLLICYLRKNL